MHSFQGCWLSIAVLVFAGCAHKTVADLVASAEPGTVVHRTRQTATITPEDGFGDSAAIVFSEKSEVKLEDGTVGFFVRFTDGQRVFLVREPFIYGTFDATLNILNPGAPIYTIPKQLKGTWYLAEQDDGLLLIEACKLFERSLEVPYACVFGCWAATELLEYTLPVIRPTGEVVTQRCDDEAGLMYVEMESVEDESVSK